MPDPIPTMESSVPVVEPTETPSEPVVEETLEVNDDTETPASDVPLYDLPDGRKVPAEVVKTEYENLMRDYTHKSQRLAEYERVGKPVEIKEDVPEWKRPDYVPKSYAEIIEIAEARAIERIKEEENQQKESQRAIVSAIDAQIAEIKKTDPRLDENALFLHASKYGFRDLVKAHENYKAIEDAKLSVEQRTLKNMQSRKDTPIAGTPGVTPPSSGHVYGEHAKYGSALEFLQSQK